LNWRGAIKIMGGTAVAGLLGSRAQSRRLQDTNRFATIIDGNLVAPIDPEKSLDAVTAAQVRSAGLTAFKMTLGGSGNRNKAETKAELEDLARGVALNPGLFMQIATAADFALARRTGRTGIIFSFEAAEMLEGRVENVDYFRSAGVLVMGLSYNGITPFASGVLAPRSTGLTQLGREAVGRMNTLGVTIDVSHSDEASSMGTLATSATPLLITHAGCAAIHRHPRNKSDALLRALAAKGGVVGIYELSYLVPSPAQPKLDDYLAHLVHALDVCGEDHVGIGTDGLLMPFDTSPENMKAWTVEIERRKATGVGAPGEGPPPFVIGLNRPDRCTVIADALRRRGYSSRIADKVLGLNFERVFTDTWKTA
jgi:membrane dipeptidase